MENLAALLFLFLQHGGPWGSSERCNEFSCQELCDGGATFRFKTDPKSQTTKRLRYNNTSTPLPLSNKALHNSYLPFLQVQITPVPSLHQTHRSIPRTLAVAIAPPSYSTRPCRQYACPNCQRNLGRVNHFGAILKVRL